MLAIADIGPIFNPFFLCLAVLALTAGMVVAVATVSIVRGMAHRRTSGVVGSAWLLIGVLLGLTLGVITMCWIGRGFFVDPSIPSRAPSRESIIGHWSMDVFSQEQMHQDGGYPPATPTIAFRDDGTFTMTAMPDWWFRPDGTSTQRLHSGNGQWAITEFQGRWQVKLTFLVIDGRSITLLSSIAIGDWNEVRSLYYRPGDRPYFISFKKD